MAETAEKRSWKGIKKKTRHGKQGKGKGARKECNVGRQYKDHNRQGTNKAMEQERAVGRAGREESKAGEWPGGKEGSNAG